jgi:hypothetical protein
MQRTFVAVTLRRAATRELRRPVLKSASRLKCKPYNREK